LDYDGGVFAGDRDRERAAALLREHYARGRLSVAELSTRTERVFEARSHADVRAALSGLPVPLDALELVAVGRWMAQAAVRGAVLVVFTGAYLLFTFVLLLALALTLLIHGASGTELVAFLVVWLVPTYLLSRLWHRKPPRRRPSP
jgi:hypothetical protein